MQKIAEKIAKIILSHQYVRIISHNDADGITAGSIAAMALQRAGIDHEIEFIKQLEPAIVERLRNDEHELIWFTDLGSGMLEDLRGMSAVITDHHVPQQQSPEVSRTKRGDLMMFAAAIARAQKAYPEQLNPHLINRDGAHDLSGAGATYLVARAMNKANKDLAVLAVVGAVGDLQARRNCRLEGTNRRIINDALSADMLEARLDLRLYGRESRTLPTLLQYSDDPMLPGLTGNYQACEQFLTVLGIPLKHQEHWRRWIDLDHDERRTICSSLVIRVIESGFGHSAAKRLIGEVYILPNEQPGTALHDAKEFATLLNACGRYNKAEVGYHVCMGDREEWYDRAKQQLKGHRMNIAQTLRILEDIGIQTMENLQYFHAEDRIIDTVAGTAAGKLLGSGEIPRDKPIIGMVYTEEGTTVKVSARTTRQLVNRGLDLAKIMKHAAERVAGVGGGHNIAAGAFIPIGAEERFLNIADRLIEQQLNAKPRDTHHTQESQQEQ